MSTALVADYGSDSSSCEDDDESNGHKPKVTEMKTQNNLTSADVLLENMHNKSSSVFANPFLEAENSKLDVLEKHVKMTSTKDETSVPGKKLCWKFQKGKCHYGDKCRYAHPDEMLALNTQKMSMIIEPDEDMEKDEPKKKKRCGLKNGLEPPKKYMKIYNKLKFS